MTGKPPYRELDPLAAVRKILENDMPPFPADTSPELNDFLTSCFQKDPLKRSAISELQYHPWIRKFGRRRSSRPFRSEESTEDLNAMLHRLKAPSNLYGFDYIRDDELALIVRRDSYSLVESFEERNFIWRSPQDLESDALRSQFCDLQAENRLLQLLVQHLAQESGGRQVNEIPEKVKSTIQRVEKLAIETSSETKLAQTVFDSVNLPITMFDGGTRGILLVKKGANLTSSWKKRWVVLQDNFFFFYKPDCGEDNPLFVIHLGGKKITPLAERSTGKKNCFQLTCGGNLWMFAAANPEILIKWVTALDEVHHWCETTTSPPSSALNHPVTTLSNSGGDAPTRTLTTPITKRSRTVPRSVTHSKKSASTHDPFPGIPLRNDSSADLLAVLTSPERRLSGG